MSVVMRPHSCGGAMSCRQLQIILSAGHTVIAQCPCSLTDSLLESMSILQSLCSKRTSRHLFLMQLFFLCIYVTSTFYRIHSEAYESNSHSHFFPNMSAKAIKRQMTDSETSAICKRFQMEAWRLSANQVVDSCCGCAPPDCTTPHLREASPR